MQKPLVGECIAYYDNYLKLVGEGDFSELFAQTTKEAVAFFEAIPAEKHNYRYAENKWTIKDVLMHIIDTERVLSYRALAIARGDTQTKLPYMDEDGYAANVDVTDRSMESILAEFQALRTASQYFFEHLTEEQSKTIGNSNGYPTTPRALGYVLIGHILHHCNVIQERYL